MEHQNKNPNVIRARLEKREKMPNSKLTETEVIRIKLMLQRGKMPLSKIAKQFGITHTQLNRIRKGENWGHVKIPEKAK